MSSAQLKREVNDDSLKKLFQEKERIQRRCLTKVHRRGWDEYKLNLLISYIFITA